MPDSTRSKSITRPTASGWSSDSRTSDSFGRFQASEAAIHEFLSRAMKPAGDHRPRGEPHRRRPCDSCSPRRPGETDAGGPKTTSEPDETALRFPRELRAIGSRRPGSETLRGALDRDLSLAELERSRRRTR